MIKFVEQQTLLCLSLPPLTDVHQHVDRADDLTRRIPQRCWKRNEWNARAVRSFSDRLGVTDRSPFPQGDRHRTLMMRQGCAVRIVEFPGDAPFVATQNRRPAREIDRSLVEVGDLALGVRRVNGCRNSREQLLQASLAVQKLTLSFFTLCDVPRDFRSTDDLARRV